MIDLKMITTTEDLLKEACASSIEALWEAGFNLDDWDVCFVSKTRLVEGCREFDEEGYPLYEPEPIDEAFWLMMRMESYCVGYEEVKYGDKWYYLCYHS